MQDASMIYKILNMQQPYQFTKNQFLNLIQNKEALILYIPEPPMQGSEFVNTYRKKNIFNEVLIPLFYTFENRKLNLNNYIRDFRKTNPNVKIVTKFRSFIKNKANLIDLSGLVELFYITLKFKSKFKILNDFFTYINGIVEENAKDKKDIYIIYEGTTNNHLIIDLLFKLVRKHGFKISKKKDFGNLNIKGFLGYNEIDNYFKVYPLLSEVKNDPSKLEFKFNVYKKYIEDISDEKIEEDDDNEKIENNKKEIDILIDKFDTKLKEKSKNNYQKLLKEIEQSTNVKDILNSDSQIIDQHYNKISQLNPQKSFGENLQEIIKSSDEKKKSKINLITKYIKSINEKYNGIINITENINKTADAYYNPIDIVGLKNVNIYGKTETEFDSVLDNAMFDLIKSIEKYKEVHLKVKKIETEIIDTNKSRFKEFRVTVKATDKPDEHPYIITFRVPYPIKGKYLKLDGNTYIMINQFYPKPILKVKPSIVRLYTHYSTLSIQLKNHKITEFEGIEAIFKEANKLIKSNLEWAENYDNEKISSIKEKFDLPDITMLKFETK